MEYRDSERETKPPIRGTGTFSSAVVADEFQQARERAEARLEALALVLTQPLEAAARAGEAGRVASQTLPGVLGSR